MAKVGNTELSYIDLLSMLWEDVQSDTGIPGRDGDRIAECLDRLRELLFKYSA